jgi:hypothetical protein
MSIVYEYSVLYLSIHAVYSVWCIIITCPYMPTRATEFLLAAPNEGLQWRSAVDSEYSEYSVVYSAVYSEYSAVYSEYSEYSVVYSAVYSEYSAVYSEYSEYSVVYSESSVVYSEYSVVYSEYSAQCIHHHTRACRRGLSERESEIESIVDSLQWISMVYGVWCMVYGVWCMVRGVWCMVCGV